MCSLRCDRGLAPGARASLTRGISLVSTYRIRRELALTEPEIRDFSDLGHRYCGWISPRIACREKV